MLYFLLTIGVLANIKQGIFADDNNNLKVCNFFISLSNWYGISMVYVQNIKQIDMQYKFSNYMINISFVIVLF